MLNITSRSWLLLPLLIISQDKHTGQTEQCSVWRYVVMWDRGDNMGARELCHPATTWYLPNIPGRPVSSSHPCLLPPGDIFINELAWLWLDEHEMIVLCCGSLLLGSRLGSSWAHGKMFGVNVKTVVTTTPGTSAASEGPLNCWELVGTKTDCWALPSLAAPSLLIKHQIQSCRLPLWLWTAVCLFS